jgi:hypothetical protein
MPQSAELAEVVLTRQAHHLGQYRELQDALAAASGAAAKVGGSKDDEPLPPPQLLSFQQYMWLAAILVRHYGASACPYAMLTPVGW